MVTACAVIGAQFGDEGKGLFVDYLADLYDGKTTVVVRSNGGSQAAHTVTTPEGQRHVFSHFGSGTMSGASTHLSRYMICNPITFLRERRKLIDVQCINPPRVTVDPQAMVSIPFDSLINQAVETHRSLYRHGSCGLGIGETVERHTHPQGFPVPVSALSALDLEGLRTIRAEWVRKRLAVLGVDAVPEPYGELIAEDAISEQFLRDCEEFLSCVEIVPDAEIVSLGDYIVFEGAQGLALDQTMGAFPYVTRSNTGLRNIVDLAHLAGIDAIEAYYVSRCYTTRHGAGPLAHEAQWRADDVEVVDPTNVPNSWQGSLRLAPLDIGILAENIAQDLRHHGGMRISPSLVLTCLDQVKGELDIYRGDIALRVTPSELSAMLCATIAPVIESWGPTRRDIRCPEYLAVG